MQCTAPVFYITAANNARVIKRKDTMSGRPSGIYTACKMPGAMYKLPGEKRKWKKPGTMYGCPGEKRPCKKTGAMYGRPGKNMILNV